MLVEFHELAIQKWQGNQEMSHCVPVAVLRGPRSRLDAAQLSLHLRVKVGLGRLTVIANVPKHALAVSCEQEKGETR